MGKLFIEKINEQLQSAAVQSNLRWKFFGEIVFFTFWHAQILRLLFYVKKSLLHVNDFSIWITIDFVLVLPYQASFVCMWICQEFVVPICMWIVAIAILHDDLFIVNMLM